MYVFEPLILKILFDKDVLVSRIENTIENGNQKLHFSDILFLAAKVLRFTYPHRHKGNSSNKWYKHQLNKEGFQILVQ